MIMSWDVSRGALNKGHSSVMAIMSHHKINTIQCKIKKCISHPQSHSCKLHKTSGENTSTSQCPQNYTQERLKKSPQARKR